MRATLFVLGLLVPGAPLLAAAADPLSAKGVEFFEKRIRPVLVENCYKCHSAQSEKLKGGLRVDSREGLLTGGDSGPSLVPGQPDKSLLIKAVRYTNPDLAMPPKDKKLSDEQIADLETWVRMGASDPRLAATTGEVKPAGRIDWEQVRQHWAFRPVAHPPVPKVSEAGSWVQSPVDAFILAKLQENKLQPAPAADRRTWIRRATYDLTGLPPTPEEVEAFVQDKSSSAFAKVVDRLLDSPRYGERWGRHWLDVARYADTTGDRANRADPRYPYAWTYRDYVINAMNRDVPFDQFITQQIAGDRVAGDDKAVLAALGFLTVGKRFMNNPNDVIDDRIDVVSQGFLGLTVSCARCHDHKFDPIPTRDYYSLHGVFSSSVEPSEEPLLAEPKMTDSYRDYVKQVATVEDEVKKFREVELSKLLGTMRQKIAAYLLAADELGDGGAKVNLSTVARKHGLDVNVLELWEGTMRRWAKDNHPVLVPWFAFAALSPAEFATKTRPLLHEIVSGSVSGKAVNPGVAHAFREQTPSSLQEVATLYGRVFGEVDKAWQAELADAKKSGKEPDALPDREQEAVRAVFYAEDAAMQMDARQVRRLLGNQNQNKENQIRAKAVGLHMAHPGSPPRAMVVSDVPKPKDSRVFIRGEPRNLGPVVPRQFLEVLAGEQRAPFQDGSGRLELARSIASRDNPLTARVIVNRVWQHHFGEAIVRTPNDFGLRSEPPTHPELLDYLAARFMDQNWSLKQLHRLLMLTSAYQQDSRFDARSAEIDPANKYLWRMNLQRLEFESLRDTLVFLGGRMDTAMGGAPIPVGDLLGSPRRTVYGMVDRLQLPETYRIFDFANPDLTSGQRYTTTVPQQALFMMNSPFVVEHTRNLLARPEVQSATAMEEKVSALFRIIYQRPPTAGELGLARDYLAAQTSAPAPAPVTNKYIESAKPDRPKAKPNAKPMAKGDRPGRARPVEVEAKPLDPWERYAQVLLLGNELVFVN